MTFNLIKVNWVKFILTVFNWMKFYFIFILFCLYLIWLFRLYVIEFDCNKLDEI